jgi:hypothetical protein
MLVAKPEFSSGKVTFRRSVEARANLITTPSPDCRIELLTLSSEHVMTNKPKEQTRDVGHGVAEGERRDDDSPKSARDSPKPGSAAPILQSEDGQLCDEDTPE